MSTPEKQGLSRRHLLQFVGLAAAGATGVGAMTSCAPATPDKKPGSGGSGGTSGGEFHVGWPYKQPPEGNFNAFIPYRILTDGIYGELITLPSAYYYWDDKTWEMMLAESYELDKKTQTYTLKIKPDLTWSDGEKITSKDYLTTFYCQWAMANPFWNYVAKIDAPDDLTFTVKMNQPSTVVERYMLKMLIQPTKVYGEFADRAKKLIDGGEKVASDSDEGSKITSDLQKHLPKEYIASGPYNIDYKSISNTQISMVKNDKGFAADQVKFDKVVVYNGETPEITPLVQSKDVDYATHGFPTASEKSFMQKGFRILRAPVYSGPALMFNMDKFPEFKDVRVRQALAHAIDRTTNGKVALGESGKPVELNLGFSDSQVDEWLSAEDKAKLAKYDFDEAKATALLKEAGWKKDGKNWKKPDGKPASYEIQFPQTYADWSASATNAAEQLTSFGIKVVPRGVDDKQAPVDVDKGNFQMCIQGWGNSGNPHPYFSYVTALFTHNFPIAKLQGGKGMAFELKTKTKEGPIDLQQVVIDSGQGLDEAAQKKNVTKAALAFNELLPVVPLFERYGNNPALEGGRVKAFPKDDDPILKNSPYADNYVTMWLLLGKLEPGPG